MTWQDSIRKTRGINFGLADQARDAGRDATDAHVEPGIINPSCRGLTRMIKTEPAANRADFTVYKLLVLIRTERPKIRFQQPTNWISRCYIPEVKYARVG